MTFSKNVSSFDEFLHAINEIRVSHPQCTLVFRGQTRDRPLLSSMQRQDVASDPFMQTDVNYAWHGFALAAISDLGVSSQRHELAMALLQHYGYRSWFLDVTHDSLVALWFAVHSFKSRRLAFVDESEDPHIIYDPLLHANYERSQTGEGFVYVLGVPRSETARVLVDLVSVMPEAALRVHRQDAAAMLSTDAVEPTQFLVATLRVTDEVMSHTFPPHVSAQAMFPLPSADAVYKAFVRIPFFVPKGKLAARSILAYPLLLLPFYVHDQRDMFSEFHPHFHLVPFQYYFLYEPARANLAYSVKKNCRFKDAIPVYTPRIPYWGVVVGPPGGDEEGVIQDNRPETQPASLALWARHGDNLFFEFSLGAHLLRPFAANYDRVVRGLWVILGENWVYITKIVERFGRRGSEFSNEPGMHFTSTDRSYQCAPAPGDCTCQDLDSHMAGELSFLLTLTQLTADGTFDIGFDPELNYLVLKRQGEPRFGDPAKEKEWRQKFGTPPVSSS